MKRYLVFAGIDYYPEGGWADFIFDTDAPFSPGPPPETAEGRGPWLMVADTETDEVRFWSWSGSAWEEKNDPWCAGEHIAEQKEEWRKALLGY